jgi:carbohydrate-binding DOMON domain-containing protein
MRTTILENRLLRCGRSLLASASATAQKVSFKDPANDDNGPGTYTYPTDTVYKRGSFDITGFDVDGEGRQGRLRRHHQHALEDPWRMGVGFSVQMVFIFIDNQGGRLHRGPARAQRAVRRRPTPGTSVVILSPQGPGRVKTEVEEKVAADLRSALVVPTRTKGAGRTLSATVSRRAGRR